MSVPNQLTFLRIILTPVFALLFTSEDLRLQYLSLLVFTLASLTDWYDGYIARKFGGITSTGKYLDPLADKLLVSTAFGVFAYMDYIPVWMFLVIASRDILVTGLRAYALSTNKSFETSNFAKWKTACQMVAIYLLLVWVLASKEYANQSVLPGMLQSIEAWNLVWKAMLVITLYTLMTGILYLIENRSLLKSLAIACYRVFVPTNVR